VSLGGNPGGSVTLRQPQTHYVEVGGADVAYQVVGEGPPDLLLFNGPATHIEMNWTLPEMAEVFTRLSSFCRLIMFDRRGQGASNEAPANITWEECVEDAVAVLDAAGSKRTAVVGVAEAVPLTLLFAATYPRRIAALVLVGGYARNRVADDYPIGLTAEEWEAIEPWVAEAWGTTDLIRFANPSKVHDEGFLERAAALVRASMTPRRFALYMKQISTVDVRHVLPLISMPTLVLHNETSGISMAVGRYLADHIAGARFVELPGSDYGLVGDANTAITDEITEFLTGRRPTDVERVLSTVLFTDIVDSTALAASVGDRQWRSMLDVHDRVVREQLDRFRGREVNTTGDGFIAAFDGPARGIRCAQAILDATARVGIKLRAGLHTGECEVRGDDLSGLAVHIAARVGALASPGETLVSGTVKDLVVGSGIEFLERGEHELKGVPGTWQLYAVTP